MPIVQIHLMSGRDQEKKRKLVDNVTKAICESIDVSPKNVRIILSEMTKENYAIAGQLIMDQDDAFGEKTK